MMDGSFYDNLNSFLKDESDDLSKAAELAQTIAEMEKQDLVKLSSALGLVNCGETKLAPFWKAIQCRAKTLVAEYKERVHDEDADMFAKTFKNRLTAELGILF